MKKYLFGLLVISLVLSACTSRAEGSPVALIGSWTLTFYGSATSPTPAVPDSGAKLTFNNDGKVTGNSGCNGLGGNYKVESNQIMFSEVVSTLMACDEARMVQESAFTKVLSGTAEYVIKDNVLTISNNGTVLVFTQAPTSYPYP